MFSVFVSCALPGSPTAETRTPKNKRYSDVVGLDGLSGSPKAPSMIGIGMHTGYVAPTTGTALFHPGRYERWKNRQRDDRDVVEVFVEGGGLIDDVSGAIRMTAKIVMR